MSADTSRPAQGNALMKRLLIIHPGTGQQTSTVRFLGESLQLKRVGCLGDPARARSLIRQHDGAVDAVALDGIPITLRLGGSTRRDTVGATLAATARVPIVDGSALRDGLERWGVTLADRAQPGIFGGTKILFVPGVNHPGLVQTLARRGRAVRYADRVVVFGVSDIPAMGRRHATEKASSRTLERLEQLPLALLNPPSGNGRISRIAAPFRWADVIAGDIGTIRCYAPDRLDGKTIVVECADEEDLEDLRTRGAFVAITLMPGPDGTGSLGRWSAATIEAMMTALQPDPTAPVSENTCLDLMADLDWSPAVRYLQPKDDGVNRFAFVIHPLSISFIHKHPQFGWTRYLPDRLVERVAAHLPPMYVSTIRGARSPATGQRIEGHLLSLCATPREMMRRSEQFTYVRLRKAARMAERRGARIMGLGAFTSVVGDAGVTVAKNADIAVTSGNSLTVAATLEAAKQAVIKMGAPSLSTGRAMVVGATGSIGAVCARLLAQAILDVVLVSIEPERLIDLKRLIKNETPEARISIGTRTEDLIDGCDLIVTATSAFGQRVIDITRCKPGAVVCDVARPPDISPAEAALRPDVLVIESGEVLIPGDIDIGYDIGLPPKTSYACLAETALLAMEGRFEDYTLGREIDMGRVKEIYRLFRKHDFKLAGLRSFGEYVTDEDVAAKRALADDLRRDRAAFERLRCDGGRKLATLPATSKGVPPDRGGLASGILATLVYRSECLAATISRALGTSHPDRKV
jgi:predicted amino acid dehydrogenase